MFQRFDLMRFGYIDLNQFEFEQRNEMKFNSK